MARWKKIVLVLLLLTFVSGGSAYVFRHSIGGLAVELAMGPFDPAKAPPPPDYTLPSS